MAAVDELAEQVAPALNLARELVDGMVAAGAELDDSIIGQLDEALAACGVGQSERVDADDLAALVAGE